MKMNMLKVRAKPLIARLLQGDGKIIVELKEAVEIWTTSFAHRINFNKKEEDEINKQIPH